MSENDGNFSEGELLQWLLAELSDEGAFKLGMLMGIMGKGDRQESKKLKAELRAVTTDRDGWRGLYHRNKNGGEEDSDVGAV